MGGQFHGQIGGRHKAAHEIGIVLEAVEGTRTIGLLYSSVGGVPVTAIPSGVLVKQVILDCLPERQVSRHLSLLLVRLWCDDWDCVAHCYLLSSSSTSLRLLERKSAQEESPKLSLMSNIRFR